MEMDAIKAVSLAETEAKRLKAEAAAEGKRSLAAAEAAGREAVEAALAKAGEELTDYRKQAEKTAESAERELRLYTEEQKAALKATAEARLGQAADMIMERIVGQ